MKARRKLRAVYCSAGLLFCSLSAPAAGEARWLVKLRAGHDLFAARAVANAAQFRIVREFPAISALRGSGYFVVERSSFSPVDITAILRRDARVEWVEPVYRRRILWPPRPNDSAFDQLWALESTGQVVNGSSSVPGVDVQWFEALTFSRIPTGIVIVGVIDTGVDYAHPDLATAMWTNPAENPTNGGDDDGNGYVDDFYGYDFAGDFGALPDPDPADIDEDLGHGTHVAGTIGAVLGNGAGVCGYHPAIRVMGLKASEDGQDIPTDAAVAAIEYAIAMKTSGWNVVALNASYGGPAYSVIERDAIAAAGDAGIIFCAAAGNDGTDNDISPEYPASYPCSNIIAVAASQLNDTMASFSNYGSNTVHLAAPGHQIYSTVPTYFHTLAMVQALGSNIAADALTYAGQTTGLTATLHGCGLGYATSFPAAVFGNIALIERGTLYFSEKTSNAMSAGAIAAIIYNNTNGSFLGTLQAPGPWIPVVGISQADGQWLLAQGTQVVTVINQADPTNAYAFSEGTSMAVPQVAGAVAMLALNYPDESVTQRIARLLSNAHVTNAFIGKVRSNGRLQVAHAIDTDRDRLPDWWELEYAGTLTTLAGTNDFDSDHLTDREEYLAGTSPMDASSSLAASLALAGTNLLSLTWPAATQRTYAIETVSDPRNTWLVTETNVPATPPTCVITAVPPADIFLYRVRLE